MAIAVALDATVVRALLVPATMRLLGRLELVDAAPARAVVANRLPASEAEPKPRRGSARPLARRWPRSLVAWRGRCRRRADPRQPAGAATVDPAADAPRRRRADPLPVVLPARRRPARPPDRVVVLHRPPPGRRAGVTRPPAYGFEFVIFRAERGAFPITWASHLAITDETGKPFHYGQRAPGRAQASTGHPWRRRRADRLRPGASPASIRRTRRPPVDRAVVDARRGRHGPSHRRARRRPRRPRRARRRASGSTSR